MKAHTAAGKLQGFTDDAAWYEAAYVVGITHALNVAADGLAPAGGVPLIEPVDEMQAEHRVRALFGDIRAFYAAADVPVVFRVLGRNPAYLAELWAAVRRAYSDNRLTRRLKEALAFAVSLTTRSRFGTDFHLAELRRLGVGEGGLLEIVGMTQMFSSYTKIADTLALEADMADIAPVDRTPAPGGASR